MLLTVEECRRLAAKKTGKPQIEVEAGSVFYSEDIFQALDSVNIRRFFLPHEDITLQFDMVSVKICNLIGEMLQSHQSIKHKVISF